MWDIYYSCKTNILLILMIFLKYNSNSKIGIVIYSTLQRLVAEQSMEQGNEGDEIILLALRQIECDIPVDVNALSQPAHTRDDHRGSVQVTGHCGWSLTGTPSFPLCCPPISPPSTASAPALQPRSKS
jgi:hypothetical protein